MKAFPSASVPARSKIPSDSLEDPLSHASEVDYGTTTIAQSSVVENLTIKKADELRIVASLYNAARKQTTGSIYSVIVDISETGTLSIGVKDLMENVLAVSMLKRLDTRPGPGEAAGIRLGDIIFGINFIPTRNGSQTLIEVLKSEVKRGKKHIHIQGWRCMQLCSDEISGFRFTRADEVIVQAYALFRSKVFSNWERWNFIEILLGHMLEDLKMRAVDTHGLDPRGEQISSLASLRAKQMQVIDLERNILQAKGLRSALCVRIVQTKSQAEAVVVYVLRVEDVESGLQWIIQKRYSDFHALNEELLEMSHFAHELEFPGKRLSLGRNGIAKLVESRIVALEQYMRKMLHLLSIYATMDHSASKSLRHVQNFLGVDNYLDCIHPPPMDDQRHVELSIYRFLNDFNSPACQQCIRFINNVDLDAMIVPGTTDGYLPVLNLVRDALAEVEQFVQQQHQMQTTKLLQMRRPDFNADQQLSFVRKCIRRQVEAALFLPLRRTLFRILQTALGEKSRKMQRSIELLQQAAPNFLLVDPFVVKAKSLPATIRAFRQVIQAYLPADQGQLLIQAAKAVSALHKECQEEKKNRSRCCDHRQATEIDAATAGRRHPNHIQTTAATTTTATTTLVVCDSNGTPIPEHGMQSSRGDDDSLIPRGGGAWSGELPVCCTSTTGRSKDSSPLRPGSNFLKYVMLVRKKSSGDLFSDSDSERDPVGVGGADDARMVRKARSGSLGFLRSTAVINDSSMVSFVDGTHAFSVSLDDHEQHQEQSQQGLGQRDGGSSGSNHTRVTRRHSSDQYRRSAQSLDSIMMAIDQGKGRGGKTAATSSNWNITDINNHHITHDIEDSRKQKQSTTKDSPSTIAVDDTMGAQQEIIIISSTPSSSSSSSSNVVDVLNNSNEELKEEVTEEGSDDLLPACAVNHADINTAMSQIGWQVYKSHDSSYIREDDDDASLQLVDDEDVRHSSSDSDPSARETMTSMIVYNNEGGDATRNCDAISADDFLPLFTYSLVQAGLPQLLLVKELMTTLVSDEDTYGECGYYLATLEAATQHICDLAEQYDQSIMVTQFGHKLGDDFS